MERLKCVLLVEDDESDELQAVRSIRRSGLELEVLIARNGEDASEMLADSNNPFALVFLDIKLPLRNGFEVLQHLRDQPGRKLLPVVMLTSSSEPRDIERAFELGANSYIQKEMDPELSDSKLKMALYYWLAVDKTAQTPILTSRPALTA